MREDLKRKLDESVPEDVTLSDAKKRQIMNAAQNREIGRKPSRLLKMLPALAGVAVIGLGGILGYPYVSDWQEQDTSQESDTPLWKLEESLQGVVIPRTEYSVTINAVYYNEQSGDLVYQDGNEIYSYNIEAETETLLVPAVEEKLITDVAVEGERLIWTGAVEADMGDASELNILNLSTDETVTISDLNAMSPVIDGDQLSYLSFGSGGPSYKLLNLDTLEETTLYQSTEGADSMQAFNDGLIVVPERREAIGITELLVYDAKDGASVEEYKLPSKSVANIQLDNNKIYAQLIDDDFTAKLIVIDLETGLMSEINAPEFSAYAVHGDYVALSVPEGGAETVKLFKREGDSLSLLPALDKIKERLVKPRFTDEGTLVVDGEGEQRVIYLLKVTK